MVLPQLWYPPGAGGMWLNYLLWCYRVNDNFPDELASFEFPILKQQNPKYYPLIQFARHLDDPANSQIRLGGPYYFNFYINLCNKKSNSISVQTANEFLNYAQTNIDYNLDWGLIYRDPEQFINQLNRTAEFEITYSDPASRAVEQYINSCPLIDLTDPVMYHSTILTCWIDAVKQRFQFTQEQAVEYTYSFYQH